MKILLLHAVLSMKTKSLLSALAGLVVILTSCATDSSVTRVEMSSSGGSSKGSNHSTEGRILNGINQFRSNQGLSSLRRHSGLDKLARQHAEYMRDNRGSFSLHGKNITHAGFESRLMAAQHHHNMETISENVIAGTKLSGDIAGILVRGWTGSKGHLKNITDEWQVTGIGVAVDSDGAVFATQLFGTQNLTHSRWAGPSQQW
jgi:uncharacterized protein YkwD